MTQSVQTSIEQSVPRRVPVLLIGAIGIGALTLVVPYIQQWGGDSFSRPDADIVFAFQALLIGDGGHQRDVAHHGYVYYLLLSWWYRIWSIVGLLPLHKLSDLLASAQAIAVYERLVAAGRLLSLSIGVCFSIMFYAFVRFVTRNEIAAALAGIMIALGQGNAFQTIVLRTELLAVFFLVAAFIIVVVAGRLHSSRTWIYLAAAGLLASLAYNTKVQVLFSLLAIPVLAIAFGPSAGERGNSPVGRPGRADYYVLAALFVVVAPAWTMFVLSIGRLGPLSAIYIPAVAVFVALCAAIYARAYGLPRRNVVTGGLFLFIGFGAGLLLIFLHYDRTLFVIDANPLEHMAAFVVQKDLRSDDVALGRDGSRMAMAVATHIWKVWSGAVPLASTYRILLWINAAGAVGLALLGQRRQAAQVALLIGLVSALLGINSIRYGAMASVYAIFIDPWIMLAFAVLVAGVAERLPKGFGPLAYGLAVIIAAGVSQQNVVAGSADWTQPRSEICVQADGYLTKQLAASFRPLCK